MVVDGISATAITAMHNIQDVAKLARIDSITIQTRRTGNQDNRHRNPLLRQTMSGRRIIGSKGCDEYWVDEAFTVLTVNGNDLKFNNKTIRKIFS